MPWATGETEKIRPEKGFIDRYRTNVSSGIIS
jgi:hypothetical protein